jgi:hypothetical protein
MSGDSILDRARKAQERGRAAGVRFVLLELDIALMHSRAARSANLRRARRESEKKATQSYETAIYYVESLNLTGDEKKAFDIKKRQLILLLPGLDLKFEV